MMGEMWWVVVVLVVLSLLIGILVKVMEVLWWRPRRIEEHFSKQGIRGPPYRFLFGNVREMVALALDSSPSPSPKPMAAMAVVASSPHNILPRVLSFYTHWNKIYDSTFLLWFGPTPRLAVADPDLIRDILVSQASSFDRYESHPLVRQLEGEGLVSLRGEKWAHHRRSLVFLLLCLLLLSSYVGTTFLLWFGPTPRLAVADPDLIRDILVSQASSFDRYESHPLVRQLEGEGLVSLRGEKWAHRRRLLSPTFHLDNLRLIILMIGKTVIDMVAKWETIPPSEEVEIDVSDWFQGVTEDAIARTAFGRSYDDGKAVFRLQAQQMVFAAEAFRKVFIPGYRFLPTEKNKVSWNLDKEIKKNLMTLIGRRRKESAGTEGGAKDLLGQMINASAARRATGTRSCHGLPSSSSSSPTPHADAATISVHDIVEECKTFFFAGKQTSSNLLTWTTVLLAMHPEWQERAREEVVEVCGGGSSRGIPTKDQLAKLKTVGMIINETLRLYPPAVAVIRRAKADVRLGECDIPRGTELLIPIVAVHHDQRLWGADAAQFDPWRFAGGAARAARHPNAFLPFGMGARTCIGQNLAVLEAKLAVAIILQRFSFRLSPSYVHSPAVLMLLYPKYGAPVLFRSLSMKQQ